MERLRCKNQDLSNQHERFARRDKNSTLLAQSAPAKLDRCKNLTSETCEIYKKHIQEINVLDNWQEKALILVINKNDMRRFLINRLSEHKDILGDQINIMEVSNNDFLTKNQHEAASLKNQMERLSKVEQKSAEDEEKLNELSKCYADKTDILNRQIKEYSQVKAGTEEEEAAANDIFFQEGFQLCKKRIRDELMKINDQFSHNASRVEMMKAHYRREYARYHQDVLDTKLAISAQVAFNDNKRKELEEVRRRSEMEGIEKLRIDTLRQQHLALRELEEQQKQKENEERDRQLEMERLHKRQKEEEDLRTLERQQKINALRELEEKQKEDEERERQLEMDRLKKQKEEEEHLRILERQEQIKTERIRLNQEIMEAEALLKAKLAKDSVEAETVNDKCMSTVRKTNKPKTPKKKVANKSTPRKKAVKKTAAVFEKRVLRSSARNSPVRSEPLSMSQVSKKLGSIMLDGESEDNMVTEDLQPEKEDVTSPRAKITEFQSPSKRKAQLRHFRKKKKKPVVQANLDLFEDLF